MLRLASKIVVLVAAFLGTIPADNCLLKLAGSCCGGSHMVEADCPKHEHDTLCEDSHHDEHSSDAPVSDQKQHHDTCVTIPANRLVVHAQNMPVLDLHQQVAPIVFIMVGAYGPVACDMPDTRSCPKPQDSPLFLLTHSFLI